MPNLDKERIPPQKTIRSRAWLRLRRLLPFVDAEEREALSNSPGDTEERAEDKLMGAVVATLAGRGRVAVFESVAKLREANLSALSDGTIVRVSGYASVGDNGQGDYRVNVSDTNSEDDGFLTIVSADGVRLSAVLTDSVHVARAGIIGNPTEPENLIPDNDSKFDTYSVDPAWTGFGDIYLVDNTPGDLYTFATFVVPSSPSTGETAHKDAEGFGRCIGLAEVPNSEAEMGSTAIFRLHRRGHGYASNQTATLIDGDGSGAGNATLYVSPNGFADGWIFGGRFHLVTKLNSSAAQSIVIGYRAPAGPAVGGETYAVRGGLKRPLQLGKKYRFSANVQLVTGTPFNLYAGTSDTASGSVRFAANGVQPAVEGTFIADAEVFRIGVRSGQMTTGQQFSIDDVCLFEEFQDETQRPDDCGEQLQYLLDNCPGRKIKFGPRLRYYSLRGLRVGDGQKIDGGDSMLEIDVGSTRADGIKLENDGPELHNLRIVFTGAAWDGDYDSGGAQNIVGVGHFQYWNYPRVTNAKLSNLVLEGYGVGANYSHALCIGPARNVTVDNIRVPDNAGVQQAFGVYWSGEMTKAEGRDFPVNVALRNLHVGRLTATSRNGSVGLTIGGASSVSVQNLFCEYVHDTFVRITTGDLGFQPPVTPDLVNFKGSGVLIENAVCPSVRRVGFRVQNLMSYNIEPDAVILDWVSASADPATGYLTVNDHGLTDGCFVELRGGTVPSGTTAGVRYYAVWCDKNRFRLREVTQGCGNGAFISLGSAGSGVEVKAWRGRQHEYFPVRFERCVASCQEASPTQAGLMFDGCEGVSFERGRITGFRWGVRVDDETANRRCSVRNSVISGNSYTGALIESGYGVEIDSTVFEGNGVLASGGVDTSSGVTLSGGRDVAVRNCLFGKLNGETFQGHAVFIDNGAAWLERVSLLGNYCHSSTKTTMFRLDDASDLTDSSNTFLTVAGNGYASGVGITSLFNSGSTPAKFPGTSPGEGFARMRHALSGPPFDFIATAVSFGADDTSSHSSQTRTDGTNKTTILAAANRTNANGPVQFARVDSTSGNSTLFLGAGFGGSGFNNCTRIDFNLAPALTGSAVGVGRVDSSGRWVVGSTTVDNNAQLAVVSTSRGFLPPKMTTAQRLAVTSTEGLIVYDTTLGKLFVIESGGWRQITAT